MSPATLPAENPRRNRPKTWKLLAAAERAPLVPICMDDWHRYNRLAKLGYLRRTEAGFVRTVQPYARPGVQLHPRGPAGFSRAERDARRDDEGFNFAAHRRRFDEWESCR